MRLVTSGSKAEVRERFDLTHTALRESVKRAKADAGKGPPDARTNAERAELAHLRKRLKRAEMERDILFSRRVVRWAASANDALRRSPPSATTDSTPRVVGLQPSTP